MNTLEVKLDVNLGNLMSPKGLPTLKGIMINKTKTVVS